MAAIPVAMPTVLSVTMAVGARKLAKKQAIVSKLVAIEELAGVDVLCADKTGTLTQNKLTLGEPFCLDEITPDDLILAGALASRQENDDTIDLAVLGGLKDKGALKPYQVTHFTPFDPVHKRTEATVKAAGRQVLQGDEGRAAGHPGPVGQRGGGQGRRRQGGRRLRGPRFSRARRCAGGRRWRMADAGRVAAVRSAARGRQGDRRAAAKMGVKIKMVTGDALAIAREMAKTLGMGANILDGGNAR